MKTLLIIAFIALVAVGLVFGWFYFYGPCGTVVVERSISELQEAGLNYQDAFKTASSPGAALSAPINGLQAIEQATDQIPVPACLEPAKEIFIKGMQEGVDGLIAFSKKKADAVVNSHLNSSRELLNFGATELSTISKCAPFCKTNRDRASIR